MGCVNASSLTSYPIPDCYVHITFLYQKCKDGGMSRGNGLRCVNTSSLASQPTLHPIYYVHITPRAALPRLRSAARLPTRDTTEKNVSSHQGRSPAARLLTTFSVLPTLHRAPGPGQAASHRSSRREGVPGTRHRPRAPELGSRRADLYGKQEKSTHGHQTLKPILSRPTVRGVSSSVHTAGTKSNSASPATLQPRPLAAADRLVVDKS